MSFLLGSVHISGSRQMGGADQFFVRLVTALHEFEHPLLAVARSSSPIARALNSGSVEQFHLPLANSWDFYSTWRIRQLVKSRRPQIVQTYMGRATRLTRVPKASGAVHIARLGGYYKLDGYYRHADAWIGNTKGICDYLIRSGIPATRVFHIGNFVPEPELHSNASLQTLRETLRLPPEAWVIFALGRLIEKKGFDDLLHALSQLPPIVGGRPIHLLVAGDGPLFDELRILSDSLGLAERVTWLGWQDNPGRYFALADLVVCPSRHEPLGNVILEAWGYGKAVLATATEGPSELIKNDINGLLVPPVDPGKLSKRLQAVLLDADPALARLAMEGKRTLELHFSKNAIVNRYLELYRHLSNTAA